MSHKKTAVFKRDNAPEPVVKTLTESKVPAYPAGSMLIASPLEIGRIVAKIPQGNIMTMQTLRDLLARKFKADYTCGMTTGIFLRILAEAAEEEGSAESCPYWRVVRVDGRLIDKLPGGEAAQAQRLEQDGVLCRRAGKTGWKVVDVTKYAWVG